MDYSKLLVTDSEGKTTLNMEELKKLLQSEGDRRITEATPTIKTNTEKELRDNIRKEIEDEANLTAEEKAKKIIEKERETLKKDRLDFNKKQVISRFEREKIEPDDYQGFLDFVTDDADKSMELAEKHISTIKKIAEKQFQEKIKENMGENSTPPASGGAGTTPTKPTIITAF